jgi:hypothetical protein
VFDTRTGLGEKTAESGAWEIELRSPGQRKTK